RGSTAASASTRNADDARVGAVRHADLSETLRGMRLPLNLEADAEVRRKRSSSIHTFSCRAVPSTSNGTGTPPLLRPTRLFNEGRFDNLREPSRRASASGALHLDTSGRRLRFRMGGHTYTME
ncbi:hypothetical protein PMAYCL1PPCAC_26262, partial [Pristionchus mayeri]